MIDAAFPQANNDPEERRPLIEAALHVRSQLVAGCRPYELQTKFPPPPQPTWNDVFGLIDDIQDLVGVRYKLPKEQRPRTPRSPKPRNPAQILSLVSRADNPNEKTEPAQSEAESKPKE